MKEPKKTPAFEEVKKEGDSKTLWTGNSQEKREGKFSYSFKAETLSKLDDFQFDIDLDLKRQKSDSTVKASTLRKARY